ncbi:hypothetical protein EHS25_004377 [Saitozyma podzolica]|uniref:Uncharacterized protein n=1 Tax=Saitozyma podzolica TaxID=1890683 RepID=A0A427YTU9_9TREE|nr:hypothetical protein EHS25_004377 [Saitozyma podzolica]
MLPSDVFSQHVVLKLPAPFPIKVSSLAAYSMAFSIARNGMSALHTDLSASLERMTFSPQPNLPDNRADMLLSRKSVPQHRRKQIRVLVSVSGIPRLPPHKEATWQTSSLYTFSPYSGLIISHEVETIRPLPGEGVAEWVMSRLLGWTTRHAAGEGAMPAPRAMAVEPEPEVVRFKRQERGRHQ